MSPASGNASGDEDKWYESCFHSINVPSEWEHIEYSNFNKADLKVSIQLMSPASGN